MTALSWIVFSLTAAGFFLSLAVTLWYARRDKKAGGGKPLEWTGERIWTAVIAVVGLVAWVGTLILQFIAPLFPSK